MTATTSSRVLLAGVLFALYALSLAFFINTNLASGQSGPDVVISGLLLSVPLVLLYFSIGLLITAGQQRRSQGRISPGLAKSIFLTPRIAGLLIVLFVGTFALDVFDGSAAWWMQLAGFLAHAAPSIAIAILLALAWRRPQVGFWVFLAAAIFFLRFVSFRPGQSLVQFLVNEAPHMLLFSGPMAAIAGLFLADWRWKPDLRPQ